MSTLLTKEGSFMAKVTSWGDGKTTTGKDTFSIDFEIIDEPYTGMTQRWTGFLDNEQGEERVHAVLTVCGWAPGKALACMKDAVVQVKVSRRESGGRAFYNVQYVNPPPAAGKRATMSENGAKAFLARMNQVAQRSAEQKGEDPFA